jgi:hypothetical protein
MRALHGTQNEATLEAPTSHALSKEPNGCSQSLLRDTEKVTSLSHMDFHGKLIESQIAHFAS